MEGGVHDRGCVCGGGGHVWQGKHAWQGGVWQGHAWQGVCVAGHARTPQGIRRDTVNERAVRNLLKCILVIYFLTVLDIRTAVPVVGTPFKQSWIRPYDSLV